MSDKTGGPAFPHDKYMKHGDQWGTYAHGGMTLRDYFAGQALVGMMQAMRPYTRDAAQCAADAYRQADAMIAARATGEA
jgi:hypothetical protein